jgi:hypothetical protein
MYPQLLLLLEGHLLDLLDDRRSEDDRKRLRIDSPQVVLDIDAGSAHVQPPLESTVTALEGPASPTPVLGDLGKPRDGPIEANRSGPHNLKN